jgi:hypothetical protein
LAAVQVTTGPTCRAFANRVNGGARRETPRRPNLTSKRALTRRTAKLRFHLQANGSDKGLDRLMIEGSLDHQLPTELLRIA